MRSTDVRRERTQHYALFEGKKSKWRSLLIEKYIVSAYAYAEGPVQPAFQPYLWSSPRKTNDSMALVQSEVRAPASVVLDTT
jgi:hypothetical protein